MELIILILKFNSGLILFVSYQGSDCFELAKDVANQNAIITDTISITSSVLSSIECFELCEAEEEKYLKNDAVAKWQFDYNKVICFGNDFPELSAAAHNDPISVAPGEGLLIILHIRFKQ